MRQLEFSINNFVRSWDYIRSLICIIITITIASCCIWLNYIIINTTVISVDKLWIEIPNTFLLPCCIYALLSFSHQNGYSLV